MTAPNIFLRVLEMARAERRRRSDRRAHRRILGVLGVPDAVAAGVASLSLADVIHAAPRRSRQRSSAAAYDRILRRNAWSATPALGGSESARQWPRQGIGP